MLETIIDFLSNPLHQALIGIPLSVVGNLTTDAAKEIWQALVEKDKIQQMEDLLYTSFLKALDIHSNRYDSVAKQVIHDLKVVVKPRKDLFLHAIAGVNHDSLSVPTKLDEQAIKAMFIQTTLSVFGEYFVTERRDLLEAIIDDTCVFYRDAFFENITQEQQIWLIFRESLKLEDIRSLIVEMQRNIPTRNQFESLRQHILAREPTPEKIADIERRYLDYLKRKFASIELRGISPRVQGQDIAFDLDDIFTPVKIIGNKQRNTTTLPRRQPNDYSGKVDPFVKTQNGSKIKSNPPFLGEMAIDTRRCS